MKVADNRIEGAPYVPTTKHGAKIRDLKFIVLHFTAGWTTAGDIDTLAKSDRPASAHGVLSREGEWTQIVPFDTVAWHAGPSKSNGYIGINNYSIGIEVSNIGYLKRLGDDLYQDEYGNRIHGDGNFYNGKRRAETPPVEWPEHYNTRLAKGTYVWEPFYEKQLDALEDLVRAILKAYPSIKFIVTHEEIDTRGWKTDINGGGAFPMKRFLALLDRAPAPVAPVNNTIVAVEPDRRDGAVSAVVNVRDAFKCDICNSPASGAAVGKVDTGTAVEVLHGDPEWSYVRMLNGVKAWIKSTNLIFK